jgi:hypothetical protein
MLPTRRVARQEPKAKHDRDYFMCALLQPRCLLPTNLFRIINHSSNTRLQECSHQMMPCGSPPSKKASEGDH